MPAPSDRPNYVVSWAAREEDRLLDLADALLQFTDGTALEFMLSVGGSAWKVDHNRLVRRVDKAAQLAYDEIANQSNPAATEIRTAWAEAYGRDPDPSDAWDHAIKALEFALKPIILPNDQRATLGGVVGKIESQPHTVPLIIKDNGNKEPTVDPAAALGQVLRLVWPNPDRHGSTAIRDPSIEEARAIVQIAIMVIQWVNIGVFDRS